MSWITNFKKLNNNKSQFKKHNSNETKKKLITLHTTQLILLDGRILQSYY